MSTQNQKVNKNTITSPASIFIRTYYDNLQKQISDLTALDQTGELSLTKQAELAATDINNIMAQYEKTGILVHTNKHQGTYTDLLDATTYHESMNAVVEAQAAFNSLPANIRSRFGNDPGAFLDFVSDKNNIPEMRKMGLVPPLKSEAIPPKEVVTDTPPASKKADKTSAKPSSDTE